MIISKTPLRISFVGGGSDLPSFYRLHGGAVVSTAIDKYVFVTVNKKFDDKIRVAYSQNEEVETVDEIQHKLVKPVMKLLNLNGGIEITTVADIPSSGTGLGSSSSFTVGLLNSLNAYNARFSSQEYLANQSCHIEIDICNEPIGKQDQYAAAYGGFNLIEFKKDDSVIVSPIITKAETIDELEKNLLVFYTGITRSASSILEKQNKISNEDSKIISLKKMVQLAYDMVNELQNNNLNVFGEILHENWILKKSLTDGISNNFIDNAYSTAISAGAIGGKILGAGAGGFLLFYVPPQFHISVTNALCNLRRINVKFDKLGSRIIFYN